MGSPCCESPHLKEIWRLRMNWLFFILTSILYGVSLSSVSSFHQFATNPSLKELPNMTMSAMYEAGFGLSELTYASGFTLFNVGELVGALVTGLLIQFVPYSYISFIGLVIHILSYVLYAMSTQGWMLLLSRPFSGLFVGSNLALAPTYFSDTHELYLAALRKHGEEPENKKGAQIKDILYAFHALVMAGGFLLGTGATVVFAQFPISQFRAIAWFNVAVGLLFILLQLLLFRGESQCKKLPHFSFRCWSVRWTWSSVTCADMVIIIFLTVANITHGMLTVVYVVLINPILGDFYGFSERETSYFFFGLVAAQIAGALLIILLQNLRVNNRIMFIISLLISIAAAVLLADWQSIPYDPCTEYSVYYHPGLINRYKQEIQNGSGLVTSFERYGGLLWERSMDGMPLHPIVNETPSAVVSHPPSANQINMEVLNLAANKCESLYTSLGCHWIPMSYITGKDCPDCHLLCRSLDKTLNFIQFCLGVVLLLISVPSVRVSLVNVITDYVNKQIQGVVIGIAFSSAAVSKIVSPLWIDAAYENTKKHSLLPMSIMMGIELVMLVAFILLYMKLGRKRIATVPAYQQGTEEEEEEREEEEEEEEKEAESETELTRMISEKDDN